MLREIEGVVLSIHPIGWDDAAILRKPRGVPGLLCLPMCYTAVVLASHRSVILHYIQSLHSPYYPTATALHKDVMQYNGIAIETLGFT